jgi:hypothetical protein
MVTMDKNESKAIYPPHDEPVQECGNESALLAEARKALEC